ncbi:ER membrane protein complex subunit 9 [Lates japonicus]|uniref:ER membrane protein complex subunit 9 n=1 Tax=Lates japonicus TaxID=270547 RepID=A0AAD3MIN2_LATJO|nr:ER membrane protein complex subunit 9 [Lates japonicus]
MKSQQWFINHFRSALTLGRTLHGAPGHSVMIQAQMQTRRPRYPSNPSSPSTGASSRRRPSSLATHSSGPRCQDTGLSSHKHPHNPRLPSSLATSLSGPSCLSSGLNGLASCSRGPRCGATCPSSLKHPNSTLTSSHRDNRYSITGVQVEDQWPWYLHPLCIIIFLFSVIIMGEVELSCRAYVKMYLHACLFPRCSINGLLLSSSSAGGAVCVTDCVPLLHSHLPLAPITQLALTQVEACGAQARQRIVQDIASCAARNNMRQTNAAAVGGRACPVEMLGVGRSALLVVVYRQPLGRHHKGLDQSKLNTKIAEAGASPYGNIYGSCVDTAVPGSGDFSQARLAWGWRMVMDSRRTGCSGPTPSARNASDHKRRKPSPAPGSVFSIFGRAWCVCGPSEPAPSLQNLFHYTPLGVGQHHPFLSWKGQGGRLQLWPGPAAWNGGSGGGILAGNPAWPFRGPAGVGAPEGGGRYIVIRCVSA